MRWLQRERTGYQEKLKQKKLKSLKVHFNEKKFVMEVHILSDKFGHLYDKNFYIEFLDKIRDEKKFDSKELLIKQIEKDKEVCIELIDTFKEKYEI